MTRREGIRVIIISTVAAATAVAAATGGMDVDASGDARRRRHNPLIRRLGNDDGFSGKWDGQWTVSSSNEYDCKSNCNDDNARVEGWIDDVDPDALTSEQIVTYVGLGILGFMTMLCLVCYPEIISVPCISLRDWCFSPKSLVDGAIDVGGDGGEYVGGRAETETPTRKKRKSRRGETMSTTGGHEPSKKDAEIV
jgi:hypothetical protein